MLYTNSLITKVLPTITILYTFYTYNLLYIPIQFNYPPHPSFIKI